MTADIADLFNHLSGYTKHRDYRTLLVAPDSLRSGLRAKIAEEAANARAGKPSGITLKLNSVVDEQIIDELYDASEAGVPIDLVIRGMCCLRPGVPGLSETIRVRSILGRFLEHSRVFRFANGGDEQLWIGSADAMHRNLDRRVEAIVEIRDPDVRTSLQRLLEPGHRPGHVRLGAAADGDWVRHTTNDAGEPLRDFQHTLLRRDRGAWRGGSCRVNARQQTSTSREVEAKFRVHPPFELPDAASASAPAPPPSTRPARSSSRAIYWDTSDLRLAREGITLRHRSGEGPGKDGWHLKLPIREGRVPDASIGRRDELHEDGAERHDPGCASRSGRCRGLGPRSSARSPRC